MDANEPTADEAKKLAELLAGQDEEQYGSMREGLLDSVVFPALAVFGIRFQGERRPKPKVPLGKKKAG